MFWTILVVASIVSFLFGRLHTNQSYQEHLNGCIVIQVEGDIKERFLELRELSGSYKDAEVIQKALAISEVIWEQMEKGDRVILRDKNGEERFLLVNELDPSIKFTPPPL